MPTVQRTLTRRIPIAARCLLAMVLAYPALAHAQEGVVTLDRAAVARLAATRAPNVAIAERRVEEARATRVGAGSLASTNPELSGFVGPRWSGASTATDYFVGLAWPIDVSGAASKRIEVASERTRLAASELAWTRNAAAAEALGFWAAARGADERVTLETARLASDRAVLRAAEVRRKAGTAGDGDVALARALEAQGVARVTLAERERDAAIARLRARVGLGPKAQSALAGSLAPEEPKPLDALVAQLRAQPATVRAWAALRAAESDARLQQRAGWPVPRLTASTGRDPTTYVHVGVDVPLPLYQRNQTNLAVSQARAATAASEYSSALALGEAELRAAYAEYEGARDAFHALDSAMAAIDDAEHLALRGYELGQSTLSDLATTRREASAARSARLEAEIAVAKARITLDALTGALP